MKKIILSVFFFFGMVVNAQTISQSTAMDIGITNVACSAGSGATASDNNYYRLFDLSSYSITSNYNVQSVQYGISSINIPDLPAGFPVTVTIFSTLETDLASGGYPANYTQIGTVTTNILATDLNTIVSIPITGTVLVGENLLVRVGYDVAPTNNNIALAANDLGQSAPSYLSSVGCTLPNPTDMASIGFPNAHFVLSVTGTTLGIEQKSATIATVFPNPSKGIYTLNLKETTTIKIVSLSDAAGKQISISLDSNNSFDISSYAKGIYNLNVQTSEGVMNTKIIKN